MKKIYLCGAMGCYENPDDYKVWRNNFVDVYSEYASIFNPPDFYNYEEELHKSEAEVMKFELHNLLLSDFVVVNLDRIHESVGSIMEICTAYRRGIPVIAFGDDSNLNPWLRECILRIEPDFESITKYIDSYLMKY